MLKERKQGKTGSNPIKTSSNKEKPAEKPHLMEEKNGEKKKNFKKKKGVQAVSRETFPKGAIFWYNKGEGFLNLEKGSERSKG